MSINPLDGITRPMLACVCEDISTLHYPLYAQDKEDGIRCFMKGDIGLSRTFKDIPNRHIQQSLKEAMLPDGLDGELITLDAWGKEDKYNDVQSKVMTFTGKPDFIYRVFDLANNQYGYTIRRNGLMNWLTNQKCRMWLQFVREEVCNTPEELEKFEQDALARGKEGVIIRAAHGKYKSGRSTLNEGYLLKLKRFTDDEAVIMGYEELMINCNEQESDNFGLAKRSSHQDNLEPGDTLGALIVKCPSFTEFFKIGSGFTQFERKDIWSKKLEFLGKTVTFKYQKHGMKDKPRCPIFKGMRYD